MSVLDTGVEAEKYLLDGAELLHYKSPQMILYRKRGSPDNAAADFIWLNQLQKPRIVTGTDRVRRNFLWQQNSIFTLLTFAFLRNFYAIKMF